MDQNLLEKINRWAQPLGPMGDFQTEESNKLDWLKSLSEESLGTLIEILEVKPDRLQGMGYDAEDIYWEASHALGFLGKQKPEAVLNRLSKLLKLAHTKIYCFHIVDQISNKASIPLILEILGLFDWLDEPEDTVIDFISAVGSTPGSESEVILMDFKNKFIDSEKILKEIDIALELRNRDISRFM